LSNFKFHNSSTIRTEIQAKEFPSKSATPWTKKVLQLEKSSKKLGKENRETFYIFVMKDMFLIKYNCF